MSIQVDEGIPDKELASFKEPSIHEALYQLLAFLFHQGGVRHAPEATAYDEIAAVWSYGIPPGSRFNMHEFHLPRSRPAHVSSQHVITMAGPKR